MNRSKIAFIIGIILLLTLLSVSFVVSIPTLSLTNSSIVSVNSSDYWDSLNTPADINLNDLGDVNSTGPSNGFVLTYNSTSGEWIPLSPTAVIDTNESARVNNIVSNDCSAGSVVTGFDSDGTPNCAVDADTQKKAESFYLFNDSSEIFLNGTSLNTTISQLAGGGDGNASSICSNTEVLLGNGSCMNSTLFFDDTTIADTNESIRFANLTANDCPAGQLVIGVQENGTVLCAADMGNSSWNESYADGMYIPFNGSTTNLTISNLLPFDGQNITLQHPDNSLFGIFRLIGYYSESFFEESPFKLRFGNFMNYSDIYYDGSDLIFEQTGYGFVGDYIWKNGSGIFEVNLTVDNNLTVKDQWCNATECHPFEDLLATGNDGNASSICSSDEVLLGNGTCWSSSNFFDDTDTNTEKTGNGSYLYNDSTSIFLNGTHLNTTISQLATSDNSSWNESHANSLYLPHTVIWDATFNASFDQRDKNDGNASFNESYTDTLYADISVVDTDTQKRATTFYLYNDTNEIILNSTSLNTTIDQRAIPDNSSWNESYADTLYADISVVDTDTQKSAAGSYLYNDSTTITLNGTQLNTTISQLATGDNTSWNEAYADGLYYDISNPDAYINKSDFNTTQINITSSKIEILESWLTSFFNTLFGTKDTDDLTQGTVNFYDNRSFNETYTDTLYAAAGSTDNSSWNESHANSLYLPHTVIWDATFNASFDQRDKNDGNASWNQSFASTLYAPINYGDEWNKTYADTLYAPIGSGNASWNESYADGLYANIQWNYNQTAPANTYTDSQISIVNTTANIEALGFTQGAHTSLTNVAFTNQTNTFTANQNVSGNNITDADCIIFASGGKICSG